MPAHAQTKTASGQNSPRSRSPLWTALLIPFLFLPYRWLWLPCALGATLLVFHAKVGWRERLRRDGTLIIGSIVALISRTALDPGWWLPWVLFVLLLSYLARRPWWSPSAVIPAVVAVWVVSAVLLLRPSWRLRGAHADSTVPREAVLVCAGDSLTSGVTLGSDADTYVACLRRRLGCTVINAGFANDQVGDLLKRLDKDVLSRQPTVVLVFIGGNDYLGNTPRREFSEQLEKLLARVASSSARIVMVELPTGIIWNPYAGIYRRAAVAHGAVLVPETRLRLWYSVELLARDHLSNPLTIDGIHLSPAGAARVADWLEPYVIAALATRS